VGPRAGLDAVEDGNNLLLLELGPYFPVARLVNINAILGYKRKVLEGLLESDCCTGLEGFRMESW
jgi:hypothetical protein